jgi:hypothetical protein
MWKDLAKKFPKHWNRTADNILDAAAVMVEAKKTLAAPYYKDFKKHLKLTDRIAQALVKIGKTKRFYDQDVRSKLPDSWGTMEALSQLTSNKLEQLIESGMLNTKLKRTDIEKLLNRKNAKKSEQDWSHTRKLVTIRIDRDCENPNYAQQVKESVMQTVENLRNEYDMISVHLEDHELDEQLCEKHYKKMEREMSREKREAFKWGQRICVLRRKQLKSNASLPDKQLAASGQKVFSWNREETKIITDEDGLELAFSELGIDWIDVDELMRDPDIGKRAYEKLLKTQ